MTLWIIFAAMALVAAIFLLRPMMSGGSLRVGVLTAVAAIAVAFGLYAQIGSPNVDESGVRNINEMVSSLVERLEREPADVDGWKMLGRTYLTLGNFAEAADAFRKAVDLESSRNAQTLISLGEAELAAAGQNFSPRIGAIFESALALEPTNSSALFWGGITAANRNDIATAADRWELLLETNPPPEIAASIRQRVAQWRGVAPSQAPRVPQASPAPDSGDQSGVTLSLEIGPDVKGGLPPNTVVFIIARDPQQPAPPIAVARRQLSELPATIELTDSDAMIPGRVISAFETLEIIARVSLTGRPTAQSGDWFASTTTAPGSEIEMTIDQRVP